MIELAKHIEFLLLENDCVIIPDFGGFIAHYQPARYIAEKNSYYPPIRTIGFNPQLTINDGLLTQSYMQTYHTDFPDATRIIGHAVSKLKKELHTNGNVEIPGIGTLHCNIYGTYEFHPAECGAMSPTLYGLDSFSIRKLDQLAPAAVRTTVKELLPQEIQVPNTYRHKRQWIGNAVAVAVAVMLFFLLSVPVENTYIDKGNYASLGTDGLFDAIRSQSLATTLVTTPQHPQQKGTVKNNQNTLKPVAVKVEKVAKAGQETTRPTQESPKQTASPAVKEKPQPVAKQTAVPQPKVAEKQASPTGYCIIVSSVATADDARQVLNSYQKKGYKDATIMEGNGRYRLALYNYADKAAAYKKLNELKKDEAFKNAWVLNAQ